RTRSRADPSPTRTRSEVLGELEVVYSVHERQPVVVHSSRPVDVLTRREPRRNRVGAPRAARMKVRRTTRSQVGKTTRSTPDVLGRTLRSVEVQRVELVRLSTVRLDLRRRDARAAHRDAGRADRATTDATDLRRVHLDVHAAVLVSGDELVQRDLRSTSAGVSLHRDVARNLLDNCAELRERATVAVHLVAVVAHLLQLLREFLAQPRRQPAQLVLRRTILGCRNDLLLVGVQQLLHTRTVVTGSLVVTRERTCGSVDRSLDILLCLRQILDRLGDIPASVGPLLFRLGDLGVLLCQLASDLSSTQVISVGHSNSQLVLKHLTVSLEGLQFGVQFLDPDTRVLEVTAQPSDGSPSIRDSLLAFLDVVLHTGQDLEHRVTSILVAEHQFSNPVHHTTQVVRVVLKGANFLLHLLGAVSGFLRLVGSTLSSSSALVVALLHGGARSLGALGHRAGGSCCLLRRRVQPLHRLD